MKLTLHHAQITPVLQKEISSFLRGDWSRPPVHVVNPFLAPFRCSAFKNVLVSAAHQPDSGVRMWKESKALFSQICRSVHLPFTMSRQRIASGWNDGVFLPFLLTAVAIHPGFPF